MTTPKKPPSDSLRASFVQQQKRIDQMRASARMRARLMRKVPKPEFPPGSDNVTNAGQPGQRFALVGATAAAMGMRADAHAPEEPPSQPADKQNRA